MKDIKDLSEIENNIIVRNDGFLEDKYTGLLYQKVSDTQAMALKSPLNGAFLIPNSDGTFHTDYDSTTYFLGKNNNVIPQIDPYNRGEIEVVDGKLISKFTGAEFTYDSNREAYIPHYIPDDSLEPAHIEGDFLVGDTSGRKFPIDSDGTILTPKEEFIREIQRRQAENLKKMEEDGTLEEWFSERSKLPVEKVEKTPLQLYLENIKSHPEDVTEKDLENLTTLMLKGELPEEVMAEIEKKFGKKDSINTSMEDFLSSISNEQELCDYLELNPNLSKQLHHLDSNYFGNIFSADKTANIKLEDNGERIKILISPTTDVPLSTEISILKNGSITVVKKYLEPLSVGNIAPGKTSILNARLNPNGSLAVLESNYQLTLQSPDNLSLSANASRRETLILPDGSIKQGETKEAHANCYLAHGEILEPISNRNQDPNANDEIYKNMTNLIHLGFSESYFRPKADTFVNNNNLEEKGPVL